MSDNKTVLIAEDDPSIRYFMDAALTKEGYQTILAQDGVEALEILKTRRVHLALLDIAMPNMDGLETLSKIKAVNPKIPVIMISVWKDSEYLAHAAQHNVFAYIQKPFNIQELMEKVREALSLPDPYGGSAAPKESGASFAGSLVGSLPKSGDLMKGKKKWVLFAALIVLIGGSSAYFLSRRPAAEVSQELPLKFALPYNNPIAITSAGDSIWIADWTTQLIYKHKADRDLTLEKFYTSRDGVPISLTCGDKVLWLLTRDGLIQKLNPQTCEPIATYKIPNYLPAALAWDGTNLWSCEADSKKITKHKMDDALTILVSYPYPGKNPSGMVWVGKDLWIADEGLGSIYSFRFENNIFTLIQNYVFDAHKDPSNKLSGIMYAGDSIWTVSEGNGFVFRHPLSSAKR